MEKKKYKLVASAATKENLQKLIKEYYFSYYWIITEEDKIYNTSKETFMDNVRVIFKKDRWRFERELS